MTETQLIGELMTAFKRRDAATAAGLLRTYVTTAMHALQHVLYHQNDAFNCRVNWPASEHGVRGPLHRCGLRPGHAERHRCGFCGVEEAG